MSTFDEDYEDYWRNPYNSPEKFGLSVVASVEYSDQNYQFDTRVVWSDKDGNLYTARDAGCSCPTPFEEYKTLDDLDKVDFEELEREVKDHFKSDDDPEDYNWYGGNENINEEGMTFLREVRAALKN